MRKILYHVLLWILFIKIVCCEVTDLPKSCEDLQGNGVLNIGYHVAYGNASQPFIIYCGEGDGMNSASDSVTSGARNCFELQEQGMHNEGANIIYPYSGAPETPLLVYCDQITDQGGWTVIQQRMDGTEDFYKSWAEYEEGFGDVYGEFWLGNIVIHELTEQTVNEIRIDLEDWEGEQRYAHYKLFHIASNSTDAVGIRNKNYQLSIAMYSGTAGDSLSYHHGEYFSTLDSDHDEWDGGHCTETRHGAWWYGFCAWSNLNGQYCDHGDVGSPDGVQWDGFNGYYYSHKRTSMKIRPFQGP